MELIHEGSTYNVDDNEYSRLVDIFNKAEGNLSKDDGIGSAGIQYFALSSYSFQKKVDPTERIAPEAFILLAQALQSQNRKAIVEIIPNINTEAIEGKITDSVLLIIHNPHYYESPPEEDPSEQEKETSQAPQE